MSEDKDKIPAPPDYAKSYQSGIDVFLANYMNLLEKEREAREQFDPERIRQQQALQGEFGPVQVQQQLDALKQFDPQSFAVRDELSKRVLGDLESGFDLPDEYEREIEQNIRGAQTARGNIYGNAPAAAESSVKGRAALELYQQRLNNAGSFLSGPTPAQQSLAIQAVQPDRSMAYVTPTAGSQGVNFGLQNYQNLLAQRQLVGSQGNPWASAAGGAASGAAAGSAFGPWGAVVGGVIGGASGYYSSQLVKRDIREVGTSLSGIRIVEFRYKRGRDLYRGVIAEEIQQSNPDAVFMRDGVLVVNYGLLDVPFEKQCVKCQTFKPIDNFYHRKGGKDGHRSECKVCQDTKADAWAAANPERAKASMLVRDKAWKQKNRERYLAQARIRDNARWPKRREQHREGQKRRRLANPELYRERDRERGRRYYAKYLDKCRAKGRRDDRKRQPQKTEYMRQKRLSDMNFRLAGKLRISLCQALRGKAKATSALKLLGCSLPDFRIYLESKFEPGMSWENHGKYGWHIDHIMPLAIFDLTNPEHQKRAFHFSNMQPLWAADNMSKSDKPPTVHQFDLL
jgi:hypothetical protein